MFESTIKALSLLNAESIFCAADALRKVALLGQTIWVFGNGGSAAAADHLETDLAYVRDESSTTIRVHSLSSNSALLTAVANDVGVQNIFSAQLKRKAIAGDICVIISSSGGSPNVLDAISYCKSTGIQTLGIFGAWGEGANSQVDYLIEIPSKIKDYHSVENAQLAICHALARLLRERLL